MCERLLLEATLVVVSNEIEVLHPLYRLGLIVVAVVRDAVICSSQVGEFHAAG